MGRTRTKTRNNGYETDTKAPDRFLLGGYRRISLGAFVRFHGAKWRHPDLVGREDEYVFIHVDDRSASTASFAFENEHDRKWVGPAEPNGRRAMSRDDTVEERKKDYRKDRRMDEARRDYCYEKDIARYRRIKDTPEYKERIRLQSIKNRRKAPEKQRARQAVRDAIRKGALVRGSCARCGNPDTQGHHEDYGKPLDVVWLCRAHHEERHLEIRRANLGAAK